MARFTYTTRADGRLMKKISINGKPKYLYSNDPKDLEKQYIDLQYKIKKTIIKLSINPLFHSSNMLKNGLN